MCYVRWSLNRFRAMHEKFVQMGLESPFTDERMARMLAEDEKESAEPQLEWPRVIVDITGHARVARESLLAHATQVDPTSRHWFGLPPEVADEVYPYDEYDVGRDVHGLAVDVFDDLFTGIEHAASGVRSDG